MIPIKHIMLSRKINNNNLQETFRDIVLSKDINSIFQKTTFTTSLWEIASLSSIENKRVVEHNLENNFTFKHSC